ncbi:adenylate/guanylate cyclase domain-containing protein [Alsobacter sp. SYSU BS001988]
MEAGNRQSGRRLVAILAADVAGYSRLMEADEVGAMRSLVACRMITDRSINERGGRIANTAGDSILAEFPSVVDAVECAAEIQERLNKEYRTIALRLRMGVHLGDVLVRGGDLFGENVNIAARLQGLAQPGGICLSGAAFDHSRKAVTHAFTDMGLQQVKNLNEPIQAYALLPAGAVPGRSGPLPLPEKPSIAILPFEVLGPSGHDDYLADGIMDDLTSALSRVRSFFVIARSSMIDYRRLSVSIGDVSRELGVRYVLRGSIRRSREKLRITAQLMDAVTGATLWSERYDGVVEDVFDLQDTIASNVVGAIEPSIRIAEIERARRKRPDSLDAYDLVMRALPQVWSLDKLSNLTGGILLESALKLDQNYPLALALSSWCAAQRVVYNWSSDPASDRLQAMSQAQAAAAVAADDPFVLTVLSAAYSITRERQTALFIIERALFLDPNSALAWSRSGWLRNFSDDPETAISHFENALRLSPFDPLVFSFYAGIGIAHFVAGRYGISTKWLEKASLTNPKAIWLYRNLAAAYALDGRMTEARASVQKLQQSYPGLTISDIRAVQPLSERVLDIACAGLRQAGLPD